MSGNPAAVTLEIVDFEDHRAARLRDLLTDELLARYATAEEPHLSEAAQKALSVPPQDFIANVLVLNTVGEAIGHGALRRLNGEWEVKRVISDPAARGMGAATVLMAELERIAASAGARRVILQTGGKQPEAEAFYRKLGYRQIPTYPPYEHSIPSSICFAKELQPMEDRLPSILGQE
ncbi:Ribosomal protein S18 acetylase RimI [Arthrobacter sp. 49Tsu3.1M3]|uniref:GNAT family N-acetyltransferase n=1 Tax=Arthrobacter sp. 49Tsu3.1M3 TaxID=1279029 RepID=UPI0009A7BBF9|nr:GNAT family N-acetyltransferase [Arthrobacter sp. 49Tsu3.1M3]SKB63741.1 Ribosomal protein S18 acetylase RimI [Arthrobacter sp. 49Tsu3.1M3]